MEFPSSTPIRARDELDVSQLVNYLRMESRERAVAVLTTAPGEANPHVAPEKVVDAGKGQVDVVIMAGDHLTMAMSRQLASREAGVYRGACRVYPPGTAWERYPRSTRLHLARTPEEIAELEQRLLEDVRRQVERPANDSPAAVERAETVKPRPRATPPPTPAEVVGARRADTIPPEIATPADTGALGRYLHASEREVPVVVVTRSAGVPYAFADVARLREDLAGLADVHEITTTAASWAFSEEVPPGCQAYGGAGRVYPPGTDWERDVNLSPLRFAYGMGDRDEITRALIADAMQVVASTGGLVVDPGSESMDEVSGVVEGVIADRAMVRIGSGYAVAWPELVEPGLTAEHLFAKGMSLQGRLDQESGRLDVTTPRRANADVLADYESDATILVRVSRVEAESCTVELFPGVTADIGADDVADADVDLRGLLTVGEIVPALVVQRGTDMHEWLLSIREAAPESDLPAPSILLGGPSWLAPAIPAAPVDDDATLVDDGTADEVAIEDEVEASAPSDESPVEQELRRENRQLVGRIRRLEARNTQLEAQRDRTRKELRDAHRRRARDGSAPADDSALFEDVADQLDFEIRLAWARMTLPSEKKELALTRWRYGDHFFETLASTTGVSREKVVEVIVHVLTGRDAALTSRELHMLRSGKGGDDPVVTRSNGDTCWRVSLQSNTPSARRLHYWRCTDGFIELSSVRLHDDFRP